MKARFILVGLSNPIPSTFGGIVGVESSGSGRKIEIDGALQLHGVALMMKSGWAGVKSMEESTTVTRITSSETVQPLLPL